MVADCPENSVKLFRKSCIGSQKLFKLTAFPTTFFIHIYAEIKSLCVGFSLSRDKIWDDYFYSKLQEAKKNVML